MNSFGIICNTPLHILLSAVTYIVMGYYIYWYFPYKSLLTNVFIVPGVLS